MKAPSMHNSHILVCINLNDLILPSDPRGVITCCAKGDGRHAFEASPATVNCITTCKG